MTLNFYKTLTPLDIILWKFPTIPNFNSIRDIFTKQKAGFIICLNLGDWNSNFIIFVFIIYYLNSNLLNNNK